MELSILLITKRYAIFNSPQIYIGIAMIDIINGYGFKRNHDNTVLFPLSHFASVIGLQPYQVKEHYFHCVADRCFSEGEFHTEEVQNGGIEVYIPCKSIGNLIDSLTFEKIIEGVQIDNAMRLLGKHVETQDIVGECFGSYSYDYTDPLRKANEHLPPISESISKHEDYQ